MGEERKTKLEEITLRGFKSFDSSDNTLKLGDINVLIGPNGSGKSNVVTFFQMLGYMMTGALQTYIGQNGFSSSFLYYGPKRSPRFSATLKFKDRTYLNQYDFSLSSAAGDTLIFTEEKITYKNKEWDYPTEKYMDPGVKESGLRAALAHHDPRNAALRVIYSIVRKCQVFQFHDTSGTAKIKQGGYINDNEFLRQDGGNLAAYLYALKEKNPKHYERIVKHIKQVMTQFGDFVLKPSRNPNYIMLDWYEEGNDYLFGPHQISDGSLRFMALSTLLLQPPENLPTVIIIDEPELGLHPTAIAVLASMVRQASRYCQVILATQSPALLDEFEPQHIKVIERDEKSRSSKFRELDEKQLQEWLKEYTLSEIWEKNIIGGKP